MVLLPPGDGLAGLRLEGVHVADVVAAFGGLGAAVTGDRPHRAGGRIRAAELVVEVRVRGRHPYGLRGAATVRLRAGGRARRAAQRQEQDKSEGAGGAGGRREHGQSLRANGATPWPRARVRLTPGSWSARVRSAPGACDARLPPGQGTLTCLTNAPGYVPGAVAADRSRPAPPWGHRSGKDCLSLGTRLAVEPPPEATGFEDVEASEEPAWAPEAAGVAPAA